MNFLGKKKKKYNESEGGPALKAQIVAGRGCVGPAWEQGLCG